MASRPTGSTRPVSSSSRGQLGVGEEVARLLAKMRQEGLSAVKSTKALLRNKGIVS